MKWDPQQYARFSHARLRPITDLLSHIPLATAETVFDLGCGAGSAFDPLRVRFPNATIVGLDNYMAMLEAARNNDCGVNVIAADIASWGPDQKAALIFSNAALQWVEDHDQLLPRLMGMLLPGGVLAIQMPVVWVEPVHTILADLVREAPWNAHIDPELRPFALLSPERYAEILAPLATQLDIWETRYLHRLTGDNAVFEWIRGSSLQPMLQQSPQDLRAGFSEAYSQVLSRAYPVTGDGTTHYFMRRLFIVAIAP